MIIAYKGWFTTLNSAGGLSDADAGAALSAYGSPGVVQNAIKVLNDYEAKGLLPSGTVVFSPIEVSIEGLKARTVECRDGTTETTIDVNTGQVVKQGAPTQLFEATLSKESGGWLLEYYRATMYAC